MLYFSMIVAVIGLNLVYSHLNFTNCHIRKQHNNFEFVAYWY